MREGWREVAIGEVSEVVNGGTPKTGVAEFWGGPHRWITPAEMGGLSQPYVSETARLITDSGLQNSSARLLPPHSLVLSSRAPIGYVVINAEPMAFNQGCKGLIPNPEVDHKYLFYFLTSAVELLNELGTGATFKELSGGKLKTVRLPLPPLPEQRRIVAILDEAFAGIDRAITNTERNLANARELFESYLNSEMLAIGASWQRHPLANLCQPDRVITYGVIKLGAEVPGGVPCLRTSNVRWLRLETEGMKRISPILSAEFSRTILRGGEVLVNVRGTLGGVAAVPHAMAGWNVSREVAVVPVDSGRVIAEYLAYWIGSRASQSWLSNVKKGVAYIGINIQDLRELPVPIASTQEQADLVQRIDRFGIETRSIEATYQEKLMCLSTLKQSLLQKAFSGELTAKEADPTMALA